MPRRARERCGPRQRYDGAHRRDSRETEVERFRVAVARHFGLHVDEARLDVLGDTLGRRLAASLRGCDPYLRGIESAESSVEWSALASELTVSETYFFRNLEQRHVLRARPPELVVTDISIPGSGGNAVLEEVRQSPALERTPVNATAAHAQREDREGRLATGLDELLIKPIDIIAFGASVESILRHARVVTS